jgi:hypothetical protein
MKLPMCMHDGFSTAGRPKAQRRKNDLNDDQFASAVIPSARLTSADRIVVDRADPSDRLTVIGEALLADRPDELTVYTEMCEPFHKTVLKSFTA